jgi:hypothetical protein
MSPAGPPTNSYFPLHLEKRYSTCLASVRPSVQTPVLPKIYKINKIQTKIEINSGAEVMKGLNAGYLRHRTAQPRE